MKEDLLQYIWKYCCFDHSEAKTHQGTPISIVDPGMLDGHAGPDFKNARIRIGNTLWAGNVEIHVKSSEWEAHGHEKDPAYDNVILHVVLGHDKEIQTSRGNCPPTFELKGRIRERLLQEYQALMNSRKWIPCEDHVQEVDFLTWTSWLDRLVVERLEGKMKRIQLLMNTTGNDVEEAFYRHLAWNFGFKVNAIPFERLAKETPFRLLLRYRNDLFQLEALLFGQAGFLEGKMEGQYPVALQKEYGFLSHKLGLKNIPKSNWKLLRLRPANFPTIRIAQFAQLIHREGRMFSRVVEAAKNRQLREVFEVGVSDFWKQHYTFHKRSTFRSKRLGRDAASNILINTVVPFMFFHGKKEGVLDLCEKAVDLLEILPAENNHVIRKWKKLGKEVESAFDSQGFLQLKKYHCSGKKCLNCPIGSQLLKSKIDHDPTDT